VAYLSEHLADTIKELQIFLEGNIVNYLPHIRDRDCRRTFSESLKLGLAATLVQFCKSTKAKGLKYRNPVNKPLVIKQSS
jgi:hypothetical protein